MITVTLKDGVERSFPTNTSVIDIAKDISTGLARICMCAEVDGETVDLRYLITKNCELNLLTFDDEKGKGAFRHSSAHILAQAVKRLFPQAKMAIGPAIEDGFYYDFDIDKPFDAQQIALIEKEMKAIIKENLPIEKLVLSRHEAIELMKKADEPYKIELINDIPEGEEISFYKQGDFIDLCAGPHILSAKTIKAIKLTSINGSSGAYFKGDEKNKMLCRIYGTSFTKASDLEAHLLQKEEAKKRDHNKLGRDLKMFTTSDAIGQGLPIMMPKGAKVLQLLQRFVEDEEEKRGYLLTKTPIMAKSDLYKTSGHWEHYKDGMFIIGDKDKEDELFALRPMTCPFQFSVYNAQQHSYRDLPIRYAETATLFRNESSGEMHGLIRLRQFTISEGHIVCTKDQVSQEFKEVLQLIDYIMTTIGIEKEIKYRLSKWDPKNKAKYIGDEKTWEETQGLMRDLLIDLNINFKEEEGEAAFYGPKLDIQFKNVHGKEDTIITVQLDFALAEKFGMTYIDKDNTKKCPIIIHRTSIGSYERTLAMLIEKNAGAFPTWLSPVQAKVLPISEKYADYAIRVIKALQSEGIRTEGDFRAEKIGYKIREARNERNPFILVVGEKEEEVNGVSVRSRDGEEGLMPLSDCINKIQEEVKNKINNV
jgi:threonyl-tRNA synthetase